MITYLLIKILLLFTPVLFVENTNELYEFPKMFFVYTLGSTALLCTSWTRNKEKSTKADPLVIWFIIANVLSTMFSSHIYTSLWGYYTRFNGGLISLLIFYGLYLIARKSKERIPTQLILLPVIPVSVYSIYQHFGGITRAYATLGQPNWLAQYIGILLTVTLYELFREKDQIRKRVLLVIYFLGFTAFWFTYSLSGVFGLGLGILSLFLLNKKVILENKFNIKYLTIVIATSLVVIVTNFGVFGQRLEDALQDSPLKKVFAQTDAAGSRYNLSDPGFIRTGLWRGTLHLIASDPKILFVGTGPETFPYEFQKFRPPELNYSSEWDFILNKPHNFYLETLSEVGSFGFIPYILLLIKTIRKKDPKLTPALIVFYATNIFGWPTVTTNLLFWVFLGLI